MTLRNIGWQGVALVAMLLSSRGVALDVEAIAAANMKAVVVVEGVRADNGARVQGSGCVVSAAGHVLVTAHQAGGVEGFVARFANGAELPLRLLELDESRELALLEADAAPPSVAALGDAQNLRAGAPLVSIAAPRSLDFTTASGEVAHPYRTVRGHPVMQVSLPASHGSSGGPVFDRHGKLVGLITGELKDVPFSIVTHINNAWPMLRRHGIETPERALPSEDELALSPAPDISETTMRAVEAYNRGVIATDGQEKVAAYETATALLPDFFRAWFNLGVARHQADHIEGAIVAYERAAALDSASLAVWRNLGRLYLKESAYDQAVDAFRHAVRLAPEQPQSYNDWGEALRQADAREAAAEAYQKALSLDESYAPAHYNLGILYAEAGQRASALAHFDAYLRLRPDASDRAQIETWMAALRDH